jgi:HD-like signal output (HDOD) protein
LPKEGIVPITKYPIRDLVPGMVLARPVTLGANVVLVQQDVELNDRLIRMLRSRGVESVWVQAMATPPERQDDPEKRRLVAKREVHRFGDVSGLPWMAALCEATINEKVWQGAADKAWMPSPATSPSPPPAMEPPEQVLDLARRVRSLPTLPTIYHEVEKVIHDPQASAADVARVVGGDPAFVSALLRAANSALYCRPEPITTVTAAVSLLGLKEIRDLCLMSSVLTVFAGVEDRRVVERLWRHAIAVGSAARVVGQRLADLPAEELFLAGLLHDIGKLFWLQQAPGELERTWLAAESAGLTFSEAERESLGTPHTRLGRMIAQHWRLPRQYVEVIASHHAPEQATSWHGLCQAVQTADALAHALELGGPCLCRVPVVAAEVWQGLHWTIEDLPGLLEAVRGEFKDDVKGFAFHTDKEEDVTEAVGERT